MRSLLFSTLLSAAAAACSSAYADQQVATPQAPGPRTALAIAPDKIRAPYDVQVIRENGEVLPTYGLKGRFYVQGNANDRYVLRVTNPTDRRVEAVVSVDGLDVIDGDPGDVRKRGYIVPPHGDVRVEGFRTSLEDVATFRFSSVDGSYAGQKGKARNVGVIAVAIFEEQAPPPEQEIVASAPPPPPGRPYHWQDDVDAARRPTAASGRGGAVAHAEPAKPSRKAAPATETTVSRAEPSPAPTATPSGGAGVGAAAPRARVTSESYDGAGDYGGELERAPAPTNRQGLGTEFGEQRYSAASYTHFLRAANRPVAIAELRYNDLAGLIALGIPAQPLPDAGELMTRETADPFPGDGRFAMPPR
jgi:hypothetical protein